MSQRNFPLRTKLDALTGLRFLAAIYVVIFHGVPWIRQRFAMPGRLLTFLENGPLAVALFFILSGFLLSYTYEGNLTGAKQFVAFWEARFARIYPVYVLSLLLALPFQLRLNFLTRVAVLTMTQAWNPLQPEWAGAWNFPAWSLSVEAFFYVLFPFLQRGLSRIGDVALLILGSCSVLLCVLGQTPMQSIAGHENFGLKLLVLPLIRLPEFLFGMSLGNCLLRFGRLMRGSFYSYFSAAIALVLVCVPIGGWVSLIVLPFGMLIYSLASNSSPLAAFLSSRWMLLLGGASYSVYLLQAPFRYWVRIISERALGHEAGLITPLTPLLLVMFSVAVFKWYEEPLRRVLKGKLVPNPSRVQPAQN